MCLCRSSAGFGGTRNERYRRRSLSRKTPVPCLSALSHPAARSKGPSSGGGASSTKPVVGETRPLYIVRNSDSAKVRPALAAQISPVHSPSWRLGSVVVQLTSTRPCAAFCRCAQNVRIILAYTFSHPSGRLADTGELVVPKATEKVREEVGSVCVGRGAESRFLRPLSRPQRRVGLIRAPPA